MGAGGRKRLFATAVCGAVPFAGYAAYMFLGTVMFLLVLWSLTLAVGCYTFPGWGRR